METIETTKALKAGQNFACFNLRKPARAIPRMYDEMLRPTGSDGEQGVRACDCETPGIRVGDGLHHTGSKP